MNERYEIRSSATAAETEIFLYAEIGARGVTAAQFVQGLQMVPPAHRLVLRIHSPGGSVLDGSAIINALTARPQGFVAQIDGLAASMAGAIAVSASRVRMASNAFFMLHNASGGAEGDAASMRRNADLIEKVQEPIITAYRAKTGLSRERILAMMDAESWLNATEAKALRFADEITGEQKVSASFGAHSLRSIPRAATDWFTARLTQQNDMNATQLLNQYKALRDPGARATFFALHRDELLASSTIVSGILAEAESLAAEMANLPPYARTEFHRDNRQRINVAAEHARAARAAQGKLELAGKLDARPKAFNPATASLREIAAHFETLTGTERSAFFQAHRAKLTEANQLLKR